MRNYNTIVLHLCYILLILLVISTTSSAVVRPGHFRHANSRKPVPPPENLPDDLPEVQQYVTAQHCCKVGEYMARRSSSCRLDHPVRSNTLRKSKRLPHRQSKFTKRWQQQVTSCHQHNHLMQKCCVYRRLYVRELEFCEEKPTLLERSKCRNRVEEQYGH